MDEINGAAISDKSKYQVSIVIPVYNTEKYLTRCINSVLNQTLVQIQIILVDDGSTDDSGSICDAYVKCHPEKVVVIHKENGGLTSAWKEGSAIAKGKYIGYVDSDDYIEPEMYENLYNRIIEEKADMVCCGLKHIYEDGKHKEWSEQMKNPLDICKPEEMTETEIVALVNDGSFMGRRLQTSRVNKLVATSLVKENLGMCNEEVSIGEDFQFSLCMFLAAKKVVILKDYFPYYYFMNNSSMTMKYDPDYINKIKVLKENLLRIAKQKSEFDFEQSIWNDFLCLTVLHIKGGIYKKKTATYQEHRTDMKKVCNDEDVKKAINIYCMPNLTIAEKLFILFMKRHLYLLIYLAVRIYFR